jgi:hypothetical protein
MRRKPCAWSESSRSRTTVIRVSVRRLGLPGNATKVRGQDGHAQRLRGLDGDALGEDRVRAEGEVGVLLRRAEGQHDPVVALEVVLELHPVTVVDLHGGRA